MFYNRKGEPIELLEWVQLSENLDYKRVGRTEFPDGSFVSTIWLGMSHSWGSPSHIFEAMHFPSHVSWKFDTEEEAEIAHALIVENLEAFLQKNLVDRGEE